MRAVSAKAAPTSQEGLAGVLRCSAAAPLTRPVEGCRPPLTTRRTTVHRVAGRACTATCLRRLVNPILFRPLPPIARPPLEPRRRPSVCATRAQPVVSRVFGARLVWLVAVTGLVVRSGNYCPKPDASSPSSKRARYVPAPPSVCAGSGLTSAMCPPTPDTHTFVPSRAPSAPLPDSVHLYPPIIIIVTIIISISWPAASRSANPSITPRANFPFVWREDGP